MRCSQQLELRDKKECSREPMCIVYDTKVRFFFLAVQTMLRRKKILSRDRIRKRVQSDVMLCTDIVNRCMNNHIKKNVFITTRSISNDRFVTLTSYIDAI